MSEKKYEVNEETLKRTDKCEKSFACLSGDLTSLCVTKITSDNTTYFKCTEDAESCVYCKSFLNLEKMCACPTRLELYIRYGI
jgi:hypothetical protein